MTSKAFERCHAVTKKWEGGWVNDPKDPGGETNFGVTTSVYKRYRRSKGLPQRSVKLITKAEADDIYFNNYWLASKSNTLFAGVDLAVYDASVNSGVSRGRRWLLQSLSPNDNHPQTVKNICGKRLGFVQGLRTFRRFGRGWSRRIADIQAKGVAWALAEMAHPVSVPDILRNEAVPKRIAQQKNNRGAVGTGGATGAGGGAAALNPEQADMVGGWILGGLFLGGMALAGFFIFKAIINKHQAEAYEAEALETLQGKN